MRLPKANAASNSYGSFQELRTLRLYNQSSILCAVYGGSACKGGREGKGTVAVAARPRPHINFQPGVENRI